MASSGRIDLIVGIDFGMTFSGIAYARPNMRYPHLIKEWPGTLPGSFNNKAPSTLLYSRDGLVKEWGFSCQYHSKNKEWFKRYLDERVLLQMLDKAKASGEPPPYETIKEVRECYQDYMKCLYKHLSDKLQKDEKWDSKRVEFIFSLPSTYTTTAVSNSLRPLLANAGFGGGGRHHSVKFGLTEPQASAVYTAVELSTEFKLGDIMLVCDAGGGTTDLALLQKVSHEDDEAQLKELAPVRGYNVGSTNIDEEFRELVENRLKLAPEHEFLDSVPETMMHSAEFLAWKKAFGSLDETQYRTLPVKVPQASKLTHAGAGIKNGAMQFSHDDFRGIFDKEVDHLISYIRKEMDDMREKYPGKKLDYLVLSGGLGSSAYLQSRLKDTFTGIRSHSVAADLKVIAAADDEPQVAVVKGIVWDQLQRYQTGKKVLRSRIARASYGVVCTVDYNKNLDIGQQPYKHPLDGKLCVNTYIKWVVKKNDTISTEGSRLHEFSRVFQEEQPRVWKSTIVICHNDPDDLPTHIDKDNADVVPLCTVESDLSMVDFDQFTECKGKRRMLGMRSGEPYYKAVYQVKFAVGPGDVRFELWFRGQQWTNENSFHIQWQEGENLPEREDDVHVRPTRIFSTGRTRRDTTWDD